MCSDRSRSMPAPVVRVWRSLKIQLALFLWALRAMWLRLWGS